jgi:hypothetical protein
MWPAALAAAALVVGIAATVVRLDTPADPRMPRLGCLYPVRLAAGDCDGWCGWPRAAERWTAVTARAHARTPGNARGTCGRVALVTAAWKYLP